ncbi:DUF5684 domain-containing protein [Chryseobacterium sp. WX]|uniref:DUF5684 domain-containing protein n=1 Tax=Chryseobacterium sp. WX TaxID=3031803 RepID=UPI0024099A1B|nr:DUF5684 domain-containing protein [Chryseobacterium sp. WX]WFB67762.1 DUF5684 domain-containing protein [Chryseobacterium sp. WX]
MLTLLQTDPYNGADAASGAVAAGLGIGTMFFGLLCYIFYGYCMYKIFQKAGRQDAWAAFIPIYNTIVLLEIVKKPIWWIILFFIPLVNIYACWVVYDRLAKGFAKETPLYTILILLFGFIFIPLLGLGSDQFDSKLVPND